MDRDGQFVVAYLGEDRQIYLNNPGKTLCEFTARIIYLGGKKTIFITNIPDKFDGGLVKAPPGYQIDGI